MARVAWTARLRADRIDDYVREHANVWPEVLAAITAAGIRNYSIYRFGNRVFAYYECDDPDEAAALEAAAEATQRWRKRMLEFWEPEVATEGVVFLPEIFRLD
ncbi:MAG: L-rhamnose mutarotase [Chloroflexi bacterium]|nr:L-rhamnose mutarotase [Chloroflexota bacterium]